MSLSRSKIVSFTLLLAVGCAVADLDPVDGEDETFGDPYSETSYQARAVLALLNDPAVTAAELDGPAGLNSQAAHNLIAYRNGADHESGTDDDETFDTLVEVDQVKYVGPTALERLLDYALREGYPKSLSDVVADVIFSPQPYGSSHNHRIAQLIDDADDSIDIAVYSYSDAAIGDALEAAVARGVRVRFIFETANADRKLVGSALTNSKSARLEAMGIDVRYVNKIMHHKFAIIDGPRDIEAAADRATVVTGSGNWSFGAATRYDENSLFIAGSRPLNLMLQREFNHLWDHSRDFVVDSPFVFDASELVIDEDAVLATDAFDAFFTSANFDVTTDTFRVNGGNTVSDAVVAAIEGADASIRIASGHLRSRPISEALMAKKAASPELDIRVYLDGQEYISQFKQDDQTATLEQCLAEATTDSQTRSCLDRGFYFGFEVEDAGIDVRYKYYSYRWHYSYAVQMHHKYLIIDENELWTGSYNLSDNAEHNTFENMLVFRGPDYASLIDAYVANFETLWATKRADDALADLTTEVEAADEIPLVFEPMALTWAEVTDLKDAIFENCAQINSPEFRSNPAQHKFCPR